MATLTVGEVATAIQLSPSTIRNYTEHLILQPYLSHTATRIEAYKGAKERLYTMEDVYVLNTVKLHKTRHNSWQDIARLLEDGVREQDLPEAAMLVMPETRADSFQMMTLARQQVKALQDENEKLEEQLDEQRELHRNDIERLIQQQSDLHEQIGALKFILKMHKIDQKTGNKVDEE